MFSTGHFVYTGLHQYSVTIDESGLHNGWQKGICPNIVHKHIKYMTKATVAFTPIRTILYLQYTGYTVMNDTLSIDAYYTQNTDTQS